MSRSGCTNRRAPLLATLRLVAGLALLSGCGDPLRGADYLGESLFRVSGRVILPDGDSAESIPDEDLRISLFWANQGGGVEAPVAVRVTFPARYQLDLYTPPDPTTVQSSGQGDFALGLLILYRDFDLDGHFTPGLDASLGGPEQLVLLWAEDDLATASGDGFAAGFHAVRLDGSVCAPLPAEMVEQDPLDVNLYVGLEDAYAALRGCALRPRS